MAEQQRCRGWRARAASIVFVVVAALGFAHPSAAQEACQCKFKSSPWEAVGTKAACIAYTLKSQTSCIIEFAGTGADEKAIIAVLKEDPAKYKERAYKILLEYFRMLNAGDEKGLTSPGFLQDALLVFFRGAYLRDGSSEAFERARELDITVQKLLKGYVGAIGDTLRGDKDTASIIVDDAKILVRRGSITFDQKGEHLAMRYLPGRQ
jgi:hypothetical protein